VSTTARTPIRSASRPLRAILLAAALAAALAGCSSGKWGFPYKIDVQQGNWITQEQIALLQPGMTREQVRFALGSPTLTSVLHADRWDYPYYFKPGYGEPEERKFTVWFENDRLVRWSGDKQPTVEPFQIDKTTPAYTEPGADPDADAGADSKAATDADEQAPAEEPSTGRREMILNAPQQPTPPGAETPNPSNDAEPLR